MTFYDGHGEFVKRDRIYPYIYTAPPRTMIEWSLNSMYMNADLDGPIP
jgi:hypothetical protein